MDMLSIFTEPFFQRALVGGVLIGLIAPLLGMFLVLRRLSMIGDTLAHVTIAGVALGLLISVYPIAVGLAFALAASLAIERLRKAYKTYAELSIAVMLSGGIALATLLFTLGKGFNMNVMSYMFGSVYTLNRTDLWVVFGIAAVVTVLVFVHFKELFLMSFDEDAASVSGLPMRRLNAMVTLLTALVISAAIKIVGALLVSALLTIPVACSLIVARGFRHSVWMAIVYSEVSVIAGLIAAGIWNLAPGATVVIVLIILLVSTLIAKRGLKF